MPGFVGGLIAKSSSLRTNYVGCWALLAKEGFRYLFVGRAGTPGKAAAQVMKKRNGFLSMLALATLGTAARYLSAETIQTGTTARRTFPRIEAEALAIPPEARGRRADSPAEIRAKGWKDIAWRTYEQIQEDRLLAVAAGAVFYGLLALFPAITALVSSYALFTDAKTINDHLSFLAGMIPQGTYFVIQDQISRVLAKGEVKLGVAFVFSLMLALWSANGGMKAIIDALNVVYGEEEKRSFLKLNAISLAFTLGSLLAVLTAMGLVVVTPIVLSTIGLGAAGDALLRIGRWPALAAVVLLGLAVLYRYGPSRHAPKWKWVTVGSVLATFAWLAGSALLSYYLSTFGNYDATYGSLGAAIGMMMWMWMSTIVVLFGAELNSEIEHQTTKDSTAGPSAPMGARGAKMADTIGEASELKRRT
jgi:membrane protein